jgi:hypothetical protein
VLDHSYNNRFTAEELLHATESFRQGTAHEEVLFPFGHGDGGGGPTEEMLEYAARAADHPGLPATRQGLPAQYFAEAHQANPELPVWRGEVTVRIPSGIGRVVETNLIEEDIAEVAAGDGLLRFPVTPFSIKTFRLLPG